MNTDNATKLLKPQEVADMLGVSQQTLAIWRCDKRYALPYVKVGRYVRYRLSDVEGFLNANTVQS